MPSEVNIINKLNQVVNAGEMTFEHLRSCSAIETEGPYSLTGSGEGGELGMCEDKGAWAGGTLVVFLLKKKTTLSSEEKINKNY